MVNNEKIHKIINEHFKKKFPSSKTIKEKILELIEASELPAEIKPFFDAFEKLHQAAAVIIKNGPEKEIRDAVNDTYFAYSKLMTIGLSEYFKKHPDKKPEWLTISDEQTQLGKTSEKKAKELVDAVPLALTDKNIFNEKMEELRLSPLASQEGLFVNDAFIKDCARMGLDFEGPLNLDLKNATASQVDEALDEDIRKRFNLLNLDKDKLLVQNLKVFLSAMINQNGMPSLFFFYTFPNIKLKNTARSITLMSDYLAEYRYDFEQKQIIIRYRNNGDSIKEVAANTNIYDCEIIEFAELVFNFNPEDTEQKIVYPGRQIGQIFIPKNNQPLLWAPNLDQLLQKLVTYPDDFRVNSSADEIEGFLDVKLAESGIVVEKKAVPSLVENLFKIKKTLISSAEVYELINKYLPNLPSNTKKILLEGEVKPIENTTQKKLLDELITNSTSKSIGKFTATLLSIHDEIKQKGLFFGKENIKKIMDNQWIFISASLSVLDELHKKNPEHIFPYYSTLQLYTFPYEEKFNGKQIIQENKKEYDQLRKKLTTELEKFLLPKSEETNIFGLFRIQKKTQPPKIIPDKKSYDK